MNPSEPVASEVQWFPVYGFPGREISTEGDLRDWRPIDGFPGYEISDRGEIRSYRTKAGGKYRRDVPVEVKSFEIRRGCPAVTLNMNGNKTTIAVHRLVALAFVANPDALPHVGHIDGDQKNNNAKNLRWINRFKLTDEQVAEMRQAFLNGETARMLAERYGVSLAHAWKITALTRRDRAFKTAEAWKPIDGFDGYEVSNWGQVRSCRVSGWSSRSATEPHLLGLTFGKGGNLMVSMYRDGVRQSVRVDELVAKAFIKNPRKRNLIVHIDGNKANNRADNLKRTTEEIMSRKSQRPVTMAVIPDDTVRAIRAARLSGEPVATVALRYGTTPGYVSLIARGLKRKNVV
jgi:hypothetical protein